MSPFPEGTAPRAPRRLDPHRRDRIIDACLRVIGEAGVAGISHRRVAAVADVSLGSMTYHFEGMDELLHLAFARFADSVADTFQTRLSTASDVSEARHAVVDLIMHDVLGTDRELVLTHELYTLAARRPEYRRLTENWMARSRAALEQHFEPATARILDALIEGLSIHRALDDEPMTEEIVTDAVRRVTSASAALRAEQVATTSPSARPRTRSDLRERQS